MALSFPSNPYVGQTYVAPNGYTYTWDGTKWYVSSGGSGGGGGGGSAPIRVLNTGSLVNSATTVLNFIGKGISVVTNNSNTNQVDVTVANAGLTFFSELNVTQSADHDLNSLTAVSNANNASVAFSPKGSGANQADVGGDQRGIYATDWQKQRGSSVQVASGDYANILGGSFNQASGLHSNVLGGNKSIANAAYSTVVGGHAGNAHGIIGAVVLPGNSQGGTFSTPGVMQSVIYNIGGVTTTTTPLRLSTDNNPTPSANNQISTTDRSLKHFRGVVIAKEVQASNANIWSFTFEGLLRQDVGSTTTDFVPAGVAPTITTISNTTTGASLRLDLDNVTGCMIIEATGEAGKTIRWTGRVETVELTDDN